jgi:hypothetical protein
MQLIEGRIKVQKSVRSYNMWICEKKQANTKRKDHGQPYIYGTVFYNEWHVYHATDATVMIHMMKSQAKFIRLRDIYNCFEPMVSTHYPKLELPLYMNNMKTDKEYIVSLMVLVNGQGNIYSLAVLLL